MSINEILEAVCSTFAVSHEELKGSSRKRRIVEARACFAILSDSEGFHPSVVGRMMNRNRTTAIYYKNNYPPFIKYDEKLKLRFLKTVAKMDSDLNKGIELIEKYNQKLQEDYYDYYA